MILQALMGAANDGEIDLGLLAQGASVLQALGSSDPSQIEQHLVAAYEQGASLRQVGAVALAADMPLVGQVLREKFGIFPHHYRSTGQEIGLDAREGKPYLEHLCLMRQTKLLKRAIAWGADPDATWTRHAKAPDGSRKTTTISFIEQAIRALDAKTVGLLLEKSNNTSSFDEQSRRLFALWHGVCMIDNGRRTDSFKEQAQTQALIDMMGPGGMHAIEANLWEVSDEYGVLGERIAENILNHNSSFAGSQVRELFLPWLKASLRPGGTDHETILLAQIAQFSRQSYSHIHLPDWCISGLDAGQAQGVLGKALVACIEQVLHTLKGSNERNSIDRINAEFERILPNLRPLTQQAFPDDVQTPGPLDTILPHLGRLHWSSFYALTGPLLETIVRHWPSERGRHSAQDPEMRMLHHLLTSQSHNDRLSNSDADALTLLYQQASQEPLGVPVARRALVRM